MLAWRLQKCIVYRVIGMKAVQAAVPNMQLKAYDRVCKGHEVPAGVPHATWPTPAAMLAMQLHKCIEA